jgi:hypothetical protein
MQWIGILMTTGGAWSFIATLLPLYHVRSRETLGYLITFSLNLVIGGIIITIMNLFVDDQ